MRAKIFLTKLNELIVLLMNKNNYKKELYEGYKNRIKGYLLGLINIYF